jgi:hypothetical protein
LEARVFEAVGQEWVSVVHGHCHLGACLRVIDKVLEIEGFALRSLEILHFPWGQNDVGDIGVELDLALKMVLILDIVKQRVAIGCHPQEVSSVGLIALICRSDVELALATEVVFLLRRDFIVAHGHLALLGQLGQLDKDVSLVRKINTELEHLSGVLTRLEFNRHRYTFNQLPLPLLSVIAFAGDHRDQLKS